MPAPADPVVRRCRECGYRLDGISGHLCPECGAGFDLDDPRTFRADLVDRVLLRSGNASRVRLAELALARVGLPAIVQDEYNAAGGPVAHLWVNRDHAEEAEAALTSPPEPGPDWTCACGESHGGQFAECWSCGAAQPDGRAQAAGAAAPAVADEPPAIDRRTAAVPDVEELDEVYRTMLGILPAQVGAGWARFEQDGVELAVRTWTDEDGVAEDTAAHDPRPVFRFVVRDLAGAMPRLEAEGVSFIDAEPVETADGWAAIFVDAFGVVHELHEPRRG